MFAHIALNKAAKPLTVTIALAASLVPLNASAQAGSASETVVIDSSAVVTQALMPPMRVARAYLVEAEDTTDAVGLTQRDSSTYAVGDIIQFYALLENVGRWLPGTPEATFAVRLDLEIRDSDGNVLESIEGGTTFQGSIEHRVPIDHAYFFQHTSAGITLSEPGAYVLSYTMTDLTRPASETAPARVSFPVTVLPDA